MALLLILLVALAVVVADLWLSLPQVLYAIEPSLIQTGFSRAPPRILNDPDVVEDVRRLESVGFENLGARWERVWALDTRSWEMCLASERAAAWAGVARTGRLNRRRMLYLISALSDGGFVVTHAGTGEGFGGDGLVVQMNAAESLDDLLHAHEEALAGERAAGREPVQGLDRPARVAACRAYYAHPQIKVRRRRRGLGTVFLLGLVSSFVVAVLVWWAS